jgi:pimeloyl-ACP methyl ester carboxylesterase
MDKLLARVAVVSFGAMVVTTTTSRPSATETETETEHVASALAGETIDRSFDGGKVAQHHDESYVNRIYLPPQTAAAAAKGPVPLLVFLHGINRTHRRHRFSGNEGDPDIRALVGRMIDEGLVPPLVLAAPSSVLSCDYSLSMWPSFDLDRLVEDTSRALRDRVAIDRRRVVLVGHSGAGCNPTGGVFGAVHESTLALRSVMLIDTCLAPDNAPLLTTLAPSTDVVVTYQTRTWDRPFDAFREGFFDARANQVSREKTFAMTVFEERSPAGPHIHNAMVEDTLRAYLPRALAVRVKPEAASAVPAAGKFPAETVPGKDATHVQP